ncbi:MAG: S9 family peptidase [Gemmatimonadota bacterium]
MRTKAWLGLLLGSAVVTGARTARAQEVAAPPRPEARPVELTLHGVTRLDEYYWLRERDDPAVLAHLEAENAWTRRALAGTEERQERLFEEIVGRIPPDDATAPVALGGWWYRTRFEEGKEYPVHVRARGEPGGPEQMLLDANERAEGHDYYAASVSPLGVSPDGRVLAVAEDTIGRRIYTIRFRDLGTGLWLPDEIESATPSMAWASDSRTLFYVRQDPQTLRYRWVLRHELGTDAAADRIVYEETDETFGVGVRRSKSGRFLLLRSDQTLTSEVRWLDADDPRAEPRVLLPRERGHEYSVEHLGDHWYILTNREAENFRLVRAPLGDTRPERWEEVLPHREDVLLESVEPFTGHLVAEERKDGLTRLHVISTEGGGEHFVAFDEPAYVAFVGANLELDTPVLRFGYSSLTTPTSQYDYDMTSRARTLRKRDEVVGDFDPSRYETRRLWATVRDGARVPVSLAFRPDRAGPDGASPLLLFGYGSYGFSVDPWFNPAILSLLDRGFVYAIAHVRGGQELGRSWYDDGKLLRKWNTFHDFIDAGEYLVREGWADPGRLYALGGSAGGLLVGVVVNERPDLWDGAIAAVPFVDIVTTMLDPGIPLTTAEYDEWGNPERKEHFDYMLSYSPYDNVGAHPYPALLVTAGLHDSQVQYWEPAKWVARLRDRSTGDAPVLLHVNLDAGHGGKSGRFRRFRETALTYAFLLDRAGIGM